MLRSFKSSSTLEDHSLLLDHCLSIDLRVYPKHAKPVAFAAVTNDPDTKVISGKAGIDRGLDRLESAVKDIRHVVGHNVFRHDLKHLFAARP